MESGTGFGFALASAVVVGADLDVSPEFVAVGVLALDSEIWDDELSSVRIARKMVVMRDIRSCLWIVLAVSPRVSERLEFVFQNNAFHLPAGSLDLIGFPLVGTVNLHCIGDVL